MDYPEIVDTIEPRHRFMSAYEQHIEPPDRKWQYLLFAAEPYETIGFKLPSREIDKVQYNVKLLVMIIPKIWSASDNGSVYAAYAFMLLITSTDGKGRLWHAWTLNCIDFEMR